MHENRGTYVRRKWPLEPIAQKHVAQIIMAVPLRDDFPNHVLLVKSTCRLKASRDGLEKHPRCTMMARLERQYAIMSSFNQPGARADSVHRLYAAYLGLTGLTRRYRARKNLVPAIANLAWSPTFAVPFYNVHSEAGSLLTGGARISQSCNFGRSSRPSKHTVAYLITKPARKIQCFLTH